MRPENIARPLERRAGLPYRRRTMASVSAADASRLARELYGMEADATPLPSERDANFHLRGSRGEFVLKLAGLAERREALDLQARALSWLAERAPSLPIPRLVRTLAGAECAQADGRLVRMVTYLPGVTLADARPRSSGLRRGLGELLGRLDAALADFVHPAARGRDLLWDPPRAAEIVARHLGAIRDPARRALVEHFERQREMILAPLSPSLPVSVIHNDANDLNVLAGPPTADARERGIVGLLDFGDMVESWTVAEL